MVWATNGGHTGGLAMDHRQEPEVGSGAQAHALLAAATKGVEQLEAAASQAFCRLTALAGPLPHAATPLPRLPGAGPGGWTRYVLDMRHTAGSFRAG